ncbi:MAG: valine--tRNA ligase [Clostridia bacterium]|nr:valine--tRNA ligase [Clostridia bacterium]
MKQEMPKTYDHAIVEKKWYKWWEESGFFKARPNPDKQRYSIVMPPPNITGVLHMGHAIDNTLPDAIIRYKRMNGFETLWLPGTDHASIATEVRIVEQMAKEGIKKQDIGREAFLKRAWAWRNEYGRTITKQLRMLGFSCDWERERFTMDEGCNRAVIKVFKSLYDKGLIYRGDRIINWCPRCKTALSDAEVEYQEQNSHLWHIRYDAPDKSYSITVATTRPETMLGDTAIAVHPDDPRYRDIIGKTVIIPAVGREIPIVADEYCEMEFGTGAVKITPGHDPNDFEVGARCKLPILCVMTEDGHINELGGKYAGMDRYECRKQLLSDLESIGNLVKTEDYTHNVGTCYRCHTTIESIVSKQWFVSMKELARPAIDAVRNGEVKFVPERFSKTYFNWMENIRDWCISRQLWWGHRIPAYYCDACGEMTVSETHLQTCPHCGKPVRQDEDVLDTWFSSGMWPFSTLGYPDSTEELKYFYPTNTLVTGYDIIFFWVARMIVFGYEVMGERPFDHVYIHGLLRDAQGRKMSKSLGNGIDPMEEIYEYGADALRFSLVTGNSAGNDMRYSTDKIEAARNFCNKIYNAVRFVMMNIDADACCNIEADRLTLADSWILTRLNRIIGEVTSNIEAFELNIAAQKVYDFFWSELCDWYIELAKTSLYSQNEQAKRNTSAVLVYVITNALKLMHPFMPFITEELYQQLPNAERTIMLSAWPKQDENLLFESSEQDMETVMDMIRSIRNLRAERSVPPSQKISATIVSKNTGLFENTKPYFSRLCGLDGLEVRDGMGASKPSDIHLVFNGGEVIIPLASLVDLAEECARLDKEIAAAEFERSRAEKMLNNAGFMAKAPQAVVEGERKKLQNAQELLEKLKQRKVELQAEM